MIQKDNLTDVVERLPKADTSPISRISESTPQGKNGQQVVNSDGEVITLQQKTDR